MRQMKTKLKLFLGFGLLTLNTFIVHSEFTDQGQIANWGESAVMELFEVDVISGNEDGSLRPNASINRAEFLKTLIVAAEVDLVVDTDFLFPDVAATDWFAPYVSTAVSLGWAKGYPDGMFRPGNKINRAEAAKLLVQAFDIEYQNRSNDQFWFDGYARSLSDRGLLPYQADITNFSPATEPTRLEIFEQLYRVLRHEGRFSLGDSSGVDTRREASQLPAGQTQFEPTPSDDTYLTFSPTPATSTAKFNLSSNSSGQNVDVSPDQTNVALLELKIQSSGNAKLNGVQVRRIGNGSHADFGLIWAEYGGQIVSQKVPPQTDFVYLQMSNPITIVGTKTLTIKGDIATTAQSGNSSRWVVFLPEWIDTTAQSKIGFFPLGGKDINIR